MLDFERLRADLMDYYGSAISEFPMAMIELSNVECASDDELIAMAESEGFDLSCYE